ncbi:MAG: class I SAM-dependent methyltransferase [Streptosporangiaceae bacterium]
MSRDQRTVFGMDPETYDRVRPRYPAALLGTVASMTGIGPGGTVLEVGAGTGKATRAMAELGWRVTCLEPSPEMSRLLAISCAGQPAVTVSGHYLETFPGGERFRLIMAAQSWHWTDPAVRYQRAHALLTPGGWLALAWNTPRRNDRSLDADLDRIYREHANGLRAREPGAAGVHRGHWSSADLTANPLFGVVLHWRHDWAESYDAVRYAQLLATQSDHLMLDPADRAVLVREIQRLVEDRGDRVTLTYATDLFLAQRAP